MAPLTTEDLSLLNRFNMTEGDVLDAQFMPPRHWQPRIRDEGKRLATNVTTCKRGHRLRTRSGHCAHCHNGKHLAHQEKYRAAKYVYVAGSKTLGLIKVGSTTCYQDRNRGLNQERYGGVDDWEIIYAVSFANNFAGRAETRVHKSLRDRQVSLPYVDTYGRQQFSRELFEANASRAAFLIAECPNVGAEEYEADDFEVYDFCGDELAPELDEDITSVLRAS